jgi:hypothetical protein
MVCRLPPLVANKPQQSLTVTYSGGDINISDDVEMAIKAVNRSVPYLLKDITRKSER